MNYVPVLEYAVRAMNADGSTILEPPEMFRARWIWPTEIPKQHSIIMRLINREAQAVRIENTTVPAGQERGIVAEFPFYPDHYKLGDIRRRINEAIRQYETTPA